MLCTIFTHREHDIRVGFLRGNMLACASPVTVLTSARVLCHIFQAPLLYAVDSPKALIRHPCEVTDHRTCSDAAH